MAAVEPVDFEVADKSELAADKLESAVVDKLVADDKSVVADEAADSFAVGCKFAMARSSLSLHV